MENKMTKKEWFADIAAVVKASKVENKEEMLEFIDKQVEALETKAAKAAERAAKKKIEGDELRAAVLAVVTDELQTVDEIVAQIEGEDITRARVVTRLSQLVANGDIEKDTVKEDARKLIAYKLA